MSSTSCRAGRVGFILAWPCWLPEPSPYLLRTSGRDRGIQVTAWALIALLVLQFGLGMSNVLLALPMWSRVLHLGTAATIWVFLVILSVLLDRGSNQEIAVSDSASVPASTEMDGFDPATGIVVVAATNRPEMLDEALTRPGSRPAITAAC